MRIAQLVPAEPGWKAVFKEPDGSESLSRIVGWSVAGDGDDAEVVGVIVDPSEPGRIIAVTGAGSPGGGSFSRYRFVAPPLPPVPAAPPAPAAEPPEPEEAAQQLAKSILKRRR
jgi:hypothetical protein